MNIRKISDIHNAKSPNIYDKGSASTGLSASYAKAIMNGEENVPYNIPHDADDLSRCVVAIEQFKSHPHLSANEIQLGLERLRNSSSAWEGILTDYTKLKSMLMLNENPSAITGAMRVAVNKVIRKDIPAESLMKAESMIKSAKLQYQEGVTLETNDIHVANAIIIAAAKRTDCVTQVNSVNSVTFTPNCSNRYQEPVLIDPKVDTRCRYAVHVNFNHPKLSSVLGFNLGNKTNLQIHNALKHQGLFSDNKMRAGSYHAAITLNRNDYREHIGLTVITKR